MNCLNPKGFLFPYIRFFNCIGDNDTYDFYIANTIATPAIAYGVFSEYHKTNTGNQIFKLKKSGNKSDDIAQIILSCKIGKVSTVCAVKENNVIYLREICEPTERNFLQYGHIRFCNFAEDCTPVDIYAGDECILSDIRSTQISKYIAMTPGTYTIKIKHPDNREFLSMDSQVIRAGKYNSIYIISNKTKRFAPRGVFTIDAASYCGFYL